ncbi:hypothetical protein ColTof4_09114 [Colletotrichum tofieldiae]|nr:hypothetical protein ColTof3_03679 [Colletotrichum tofieldiae]GKT76691.1 hypothetical protein ColTof4_09114 [Colletotrichum tofieldiae]GKT87744.1 hypothetical protein Ct61P_05594 [Colletotrichum tofieldiae]
MSAAVKAIINSGRKTSWELKFKCSALPSCFVAQEARQYITTKANKDRMLTITTKDWQREGKAKSAHPPPAVIKWHRYMQMLASSMPIHQLTILLEWDPERNSTTSQR